MMKTFEKLRRNRYMGYVLLCAIALLLAGCQYLPQLAQDVESVATDTAIKIEVSRELFQDGKDLDLRVKVENKL